MRRFALALACVVVGAGCPDDDRGAASADTSTAGESTAADSSSTGTDAASTIGSATEPDSSGESTSGIFAVCGDGATEGAEVCDDANVDDGDGCSSDCASATCLVPVTHATIQAGIDDGACATVWIASGGYSEFLDVARDVELVGSGPTPPVVDAMGLGRVLDVDAGVSVVLRRLELTGGSADTGGAIRSSAQLLLDDVVVRDSRVEGALACGGAIWSDGALELRASTIRDNESVLAGDTGTASGGGVCIAGGSLQLREGTVVTGNVARASGTGALAAEGGGLFIADAAVEIDGGVELTLNRVEIEAAMSTAIGRGAALRQQGGTLAIADAAITDNTVALVGPADSGAALVAEGGALALLAVDTTVTGTAITGNTASATGPSGAVARGGGVRVSGLASVVLTDSSLANNSAIALDQSSASTASGGGMWLSLGNGAPQDALTVLVERCAIAGNTADAAMIGEGGGFAVTAQGNEARIELGVVDSTVSGGLASSRGGAIAASAAPGTEIAILLRSATITACEAGEGGGLWLAPASGTVSVDVANSAVVDNVGSDCAPAESTVDSSGHNAFGMLACTLAGGGGTDLLAPSAMLAPLADNGGPTMTHALAPASPLRNAGDPAGCVDAEGSVLATDQRGEDRHAERVCDIGAFELSP